MTRPSVTVKQPRGPSWPPAPRLLFLPVVALLAALVFTAAAPVYAQGDPLVMGVFPRRNAALTFKLFAPLASYLEKHLGRPVQLATEKDFPRFRAALMEGRYDLVHFNQFHYLSNTERYQVIARNEEAGHKTIKGGIYVRRSSGINALEQLRGKRIAFGGGPDAMMSYIVPHYLLRQAGLQDTDYTSVLTPSPPNSLLSVIYRQTDAAGVGSAALDLPSIRQLVPLHDIVAVADSEELSHLPWAVKASLPAELRTRIQSLLVQLKDTAEGRRILGRARLTDILPAEEADYDSCRHILEAMSVLEPAN